MIGAGVGGAAGLGAAAGGELMNAGLDELHNHVPAANRMLSKSPDAEQAALLASVLGGGALGLQGMKYMAGLDGPQDPRSANGQGKVAKHSKKSFFERLGSQVAKQSNGGAASMVPGAQRAATQHASHGMQHGMTQAMGASPMVNAPGNTQSSSLPKSFQGGMAMGGAAGSVANAGASAAGMPTPGAMSASIPPPAPQPQQVAQQPPQPMSPNSTRASSMMQRIVGGTQMMNQQQQQAPQQ
jgi:hypothetical protein